MSSFFGLSLLTRIAVAVAVVTILGATATATVTVTATATTTTTTSNRDVSEGSTAAIGIESGFRAIYNNYKQCEGDANTLSCLKLKALKFVDRALSVNNIPIAEGISLAKREVNQRSLNEHWKTPTTIHSAIDETVLPQQFNERSNEKLDELLWKRVKQFVESRSLQLKVNKLLFGDAGAEAEAEADAEHHNQNANDIERNAKLETGNATRDVLSARGKKDKNKGMYMYMMMMKGGMMALAYKGLALLAGKALLVSKIALTLALLVAIKKLFSGGHHSQKTTYEIVKTPIITHSHQYSGANGQNGHYGNDFTAYDGGPYARSLDEAQHQQRQRQRITLKSIDMANAEVDADVDANANANANADADADTKSRYTTLRIAGSGFRSGSGSGSAYARSLTNSGDFLPAPTTSEQVARSGFNAPYAHLAAYRKQLEAKNMLTTQTSLGREANTDSDDASITSLKSVTATVTAAAAI